MFSRSCSNTINRKIR